MKILYYIESLRSGGKERRLFELIKGLKSSYPSIEMELVLTKNEVHYSEIKKLGVKIHYTVRKGLKKDPRLFWKFYKIAYKYKPDIIHVWGNMAAFYAIPTKVLLNIPMINNQITDAPLKVKKGLFSHNMTFPFSEKILANSHAGLKAYNAPENKSKVIYNGFDFNRISNLRKKKDIKQTFNIKTKIVIGMFATFSSLKDYDSYISAAEIICVSNKDVTFLAVGSGDYKAYEDQVSEEYNEKILFLGKQTEVESIMNICDIGVLASFTEGISNSLLELMALGKPIIATGGGGTKELIDSNGFLIESSNPLLLVEKIRTLLKDNSLMEIMGNKSEGIVKTKFGIDRMTNEFYSEYRSTLNVDKR